MNKLKTTLLIILTTLINSISIVGQTMDSVVTSSYSSTTQSGKGIMDNNYLWVGLVGVIILTVLIIGVIRRKKTDQISMRRTESDGNINNPAAGI
jgi:magnesium-transporting ATPase (P-type)